MSIHRQLVAKTIKQNQQVKNIENNFQEEQKTHISL